jgi:hypothetical protein
MARRLELLSWARENKAWIVEDDYASEFRYGGRALASLQGLDDSERVIYVGTLNKALFPGLRLGYAVVPPALSKAFVTARYLVDRQPSSLAQAVVADFIEEGHFAGHIRRMRLQYKDQRDVLVAALRQRLGAGPGNASRRPSAARPVRCRDRTRGGRPWRHRSCDEQNVCRSTETIGPGDGVQRISAPDDRARGGAIGEGFGLSSRLGLFSPNKRPGQPECGSFSPRQVMAGSASGVRKTECDP